MLPLVAAKELGDRLRVQLEERGLSQQKLAESLGVSRQTVSRWLSGTVPLARTLHVLSEMFDVSPQWLLTGNDKATGIVHGRHLGAMGAAFEYRKQLGKESTAIDPLVRAYEEILHDSEHRAEMAKAKLRELSRQWHQRVADLQKSTLEKQNSLQKSNMALIGQSMGSIAIPKDIDELLESVRRITAAPGAKVGFAKAIGIRPQHLSAWLARRYQPSGEAVLRMLPRVLGFPAQSQQEKGSEGASTPSKPKTRQRKSTTK